MLSAVSHAWASWKTAPGVAILAVIAFALGIGSATAIFTVINGVLLRPLPYPASERFVALTGVRTTEPGIFWAMSVPELHDYEQQTTSFDVFGWFRGGRFQLTSPGEPQFVPGTAVTPSLARELGAPLLGRWFSDDSSAVLSYALWQRLGAPRDIIGTAITLDDRVYTVSGVMPQAFRLPIASLGMGRGNTEVWIPLNPSPPNPNRGSQQYYAYARRKPGVSLEQAQSDVKRVAAIVAATDPARYQSYTASVAALHESSADGLRAPLLILLGSAGLLLLIACANVATLLLARSVVRARETAIRVALGASRGQLAVRYFAEGALVSVAGAAAGVGLSVVFVRQILTGASAYIPRADLIAIDWKVLGFSVTVAIATGLLAALAPLWQAGATPPNAVLNEGVRASAAAPARRLSQAFVVAEIALAFALLTTSVILIVHLRNLDRVPLGYDADGVVTFNLTLPRTVAGPARYAEWERLMAAVRQTPGVTRAALATPGPTLCGAGSTAVYVDGRPPDAQRVCLVVTTPEFLSTIRIPLQNGRWLNESDGRGGQLNVVVNETAARTYWPGRDPIGASGHLSQPDGDTFNVVGVVGDVRNKGLKEPTAPDIYIPASFQAPNPVDVVVRSALPSGQLIGSIRNTIRQSNPQLAIGPVSTINETVRETVQLERLSSLVMTFFGLSAMLMAALGIYGVMSYFVRNRTVELGTRMALGAGNGDLVALVLRSGLKLSLVGVAIGSIALFGTVSVLVRYLDVTHVGWLPFVTSTAIVVFVAGAAAAVPAWRTTLLTPMAAIREQAPSVWHLAHQGMRRAVRGIREAVGSDDGTESSAADVLTAFVDAARGADSYGEALRAVLTSVCAELRVKSAALFERRDGAGADYRCLVAVGAFDAAALAIPADGFLISRLKAYPQPLPFAAGDLAALADWASSHRSDRLDEIRALAGAGVRLAVPLRTRSEILGVLLLGEHSLDPQSQADGRPQREGFTTHEKQVLRASADQFALMIENARLTDRVVEQEALRRDIALASDVQRRLLPDAPPRIDHADFVAMSLPARRIGGDYYDFVERPDGIGIALADVSGKGVAAALIMSVLQASLRIISSEDDVALPHLVARMNQFVYQSTPASKYATFFYAHFDGERRRLRYVNAGHNAPYLFRAARRTTAESTSCEIEQLSVGGTVIGMFPDMCYEEAVVELCPGDVLLAFTDGVPEAHNAADEEFGEERLQVLLRETAHFAASEIGARISAEMKDWIGEAEQYDDLTFIVMKVR